MKNTISESRIDVRKCKKLGEWSWDNHNIIDWAVEKLYVDMNGKYYLVGRGGAYTVWARKEEGFIYRSRKTSKRFCYNGSVYYPGKKTWCISEVEARAWLVEHDIVQESLNNKHKEGAIK